MTAQTFDKKRRTASDMVPPWVSKWAREASYHPVAYAPGYHSRDIPQPIVTMEDS